MLIYVRKNYKRISQYSFRVSVIEQTQGDSTNYEKEKCAITTLIIISSAHLA